MENITIRPLVKLMSAETPSGEISLGDLTQVITKIENTIAQKQKNAQQKKSIHIDKKYLTVLKCLKKNFAGKKKISKTKLATQLTRLLKEAQLYNYPRVERAAHGWNIFYQHTQKGENLETQAYDLAFYNELTPKSSGKHHTDPEKNLPGLYFARCEQRGPEILIGNLQIDGLAPKLWKNRNIGEIMSQKKNNYLSMVQETIKHSLENNCSKIMFQCGDAVEYAQWGNRYRDEVTITKDNIAHYTAQYEEALKKFDQAQRRGLAPHDEDEGVIVIKKTKEKYYHGHIDSINTRCNYSYLFAVLNELHEGSRSYVNQRDIVAAADLMQENDLPAALTKINDMFTGLRAYYYNHNYNQNWDEKIKYLRKIQKKFTGVRKPERLKNFVININDFLIKFEYEQEFLKLFRDYKKIKLRGPRRHSARHCYLEEQPLRYYSIFYRKEIVKPELGKTYKIETYPRCNFLHKNFNYYQGAIVHIVNFYNKILPEVFDKLNLKYRKVPINNNKVSAHAWEIIGGLEEFKQRPMTVFASHEKYKLDCETLPQLALAARKFGLPPEHLEIINKELGNNFSRPPRSSYTPATDRVRLANRSLALLAHECLHRLYSKKMIPEREYRALVAAGEKLTAQSPVLTKYINQKNTQGAAVYPRGAKRNQEYAALFVETYYEKPGRARQSLLGTKISRTARVLDYICAARDIVLARLGNNAAVARGFLRRVENNQLNFQLGEIKSRAKDPERASRSAQKINTSYVLGIT